MLTEVWNRIWRDKNGRIVVWQRPNLWLIIWAVSAILSHLLSHGSFAGIFSALGSMALAIWALLEIVQGINYFRRGLGVVVLLMIIANLFR